MIHEEICTYEVAKLAKEKGFDWMPSMYFHSGVESDLRVVGVNGANPNKLPYSPHISCPTQTQLQRWLREEKGLCVSVEAYPTLAIMRDVCFAWVIKSGSDGHFMESNDSLQTFSTYEHALEDALKYALENLT
jgi:hypothetical protein